MRENRPYGSEGGEDKILPDPYQGGSGTAVQYRGQTSFI